MSKTNTTDDGLAKRAEDFEREWSRLKELALAADGITRARAFVFIDDTAAALARQCLSLEDAR